MTPEWLLGELKALERIFGREDVLERNAPRELDLDLLLFDSEVRSSDEFTLPHPRAVNRLFVLAPAAEVLPEAVWPGSQRTIDQLLAAIVTDEKVTRLERTGQ